MNETMNAINLTGQLVVEKTDGITGETTTVVVPNLIVTVGKNYIAGRLKQTPQAAMTAMAIGTGSTAPVIGDTGLGAEVASSVYTSGLRAVLTNPDDPSQSGAVLTYKATFGPRSGAATVALQEAGIFDTTTLGSGNMLCRTTFGVVTKTLNDTITITWTITVS